MGNTKDVSEVHVTKLALTTGFQVASPREVPRANRGGQLRQQAK